MHLAKPLLRLPIRFDADKLAANVAALPASAWQPHPTGYAGNDAVPLVSPGGGLTDGFEGPMGPTDSLKRCPYIMDLMADLDCVWGRSRLMGLAPGAEVPVHIDVHYYWRTHVRLHIPIITNPGVIFTCNDESVHMAAGECWVFDSFALHNVQNKGNERRVHLVLDTVGSERLWDLVEEASSGRCASGIWQSPSSATRAPLAFEQINRPKVMTPWEVQRHIQYIFDHVPPGSAIRPIAKRLDRFVSGWHGAWAQFGTSDEGFPAYFSLIERVRDDIRSLNAQDIILQNRQGLGFVVEALLLRNAVSPVPVAGSVNRGSTKTNIEATRLWRGSAGVALG